MSIDLTVDVLPIESEVKALELTDPTPHTLAAAAWMVDVGRACRGIERTWTG